MGAVRHEAHSLSAFGAMLPLAFTATAIIALGFGVNLSGRPQPAQVVEAAPVVNTMSKRQEAKLAADMSAFALAKVASERLVSEATPEVFAGPALPSFQLAQVASPPRTEVKAQRKAEKPAKVASVLPPPRPAIMTPPLPVVAHAAEPGIVARVAEYVPSPRRMVDGVWSLGGRVASYIPRI